MRCSQVTDYWRPPGEMLDTQHPGGGTAAPGPVDGAVTQQQFILAPFHPSSFVTRADFAQTLVFNAALRQSLAAVPIFTDVTGPQEAVAEAVTANGSTLRDYNSGLAGLLSASGSVSRLDVAVALVRAFKVRTRPRRLWPVPMSQSATAAKIWP